MTAHSFTFVRNTSIGNVLAQSHSTLRQIFSEFEIHIHTHTFWLVNRFHTEIFYFIYFSFFFFWKYLQHKYFHPFFIRIDSVEPLKLVQCTMNAFSALKTKTFKSQISHFKCGKNISKRKKQHDWKMKKKKKKSMTPAHGMLFMLNDLLLPFSSYFHVHCLLFVVHVSFFIGMKSTCLVLQRTSFNAFWLILSCMRYDDDGNDVDNIFHFCICMYLMFVVHFEHNFTWETPLFKPFFSVLSDFAI